MKVPVAVISIVAVAISIVGCTPNIMLKNPQTSEVTVCKGGDSYGLIGLAGRNAQERCLDDFEKQGYQRVATPK
jgi:hypothetical protein